MFPNHKEKYHSPSVVTPGKHLKYLKDVRKEQPYCPENIVICYQRKLLNQIKEKYEFIRKGKIGVVNFQEKEVGVVGGFGIGSPAAAISLEDMIALGAKKIISIGSAGTLQKDLDVGELVIIDRAIRDEGTSHHYLVSEKYIDASKKLTKSLIEKMGKSSFRVGTSWTTDAPYRETEVEVRKYQEEGVLTVEMEAAALFSVATFRQVDIASIVIVSDSLADLNWKPQFQKIDNSMLELFECACRAFTGE